MDSLRIKTAPAKMRAGRHQWSRESREPRRKLMSRGAKRRLTRKRTSISGRQEIGTRTRKGYRKHRGS